jgi:hypothetical protein
MAQAKKPPSHGNPVVTFLEPLEKADIPEAWGQFYKSYFEGVSEMTAEFMGFFEARVSRDVELGKNLSECQDWTSASRVQSEWSQQTQEDYLQESKKLSDLATTLVHKSLEPWTHFTK